MNELITALKAIYLIEDYQEKHLQYHTALWAHVNAVIPTASIPDKIQFKHQLSYDFPMEIRKYENVCYSPQPDQSEDIIRLQSELAESQARIVSLNEVVAFLQNVLEERVESNESQSCHT